MKARKLLEMAMDVGGAPDAINPVHKRALRTGEHPLGKVPPLNPHTQEPSNPSERHASATYQAIIRNLRRYGGVIPRNSGDLGGVGNDMFRTLTDLARREARHKPELERLAIETVTRLPEFKTLKKALQSGHLKIEAHLGQPDLQAAKLSDEEPEQEQPEMEEPEQVTAEYDELIAKRKMANTMIQGAAVANNYAASYYAGDDLTQIDPGLARDYGKMMAYSELGQFMAAPEVARAAAQAHGEESQGGSSRLRRDDDGTITVLAYGQVFPMLVHEIIKGCMEYLSIDPDEDPETWHEVTDRADFIDDEQTQMQVGPNIWREFMAAIGDDAAEVMPYVYDELNRLPVSDYNTVMKGLIDGTPEGKQWFRDLARKIKAELPDEGREESEAHVIVDRLLG